MPTTASALQIQSDFDAIARLVPDGDRLGPHEDWLLRNLPPGRGTVLEIGCGVGHLSRRLTAAFDRVVAIDLAVVMIAEAKRRTGDNAPIEYVCADMFDWLARFLMPRTRASLWLSASCRSPAADRFPPASSPLAQAD